MPEGHSVHRIARQFERYFVDQPVAVTSPQGRFAQGAELISGRCMTDAAAVGKQMFLGFDNDLWLRVHLGIYGAWDFAGDLGLDAAAVSAGGKMGQTHQRGIDPELVADLSAAGSRPVSAMNVSSMGAPRLGVRRLDRLRMGEDQHGDTQVGAFPPPPIGQVRVRLLTGTSVADLRGPTACEVIDRVQVNQVLMRLGPDPVNDPGPEAADRFLERAAKKAPPIGLVLMDQSVIAGIGNVYRAEILFRAGIDPHTPTKQLSREQLSELWQDWAYLLPIGIETGQMLTMDDLDADRYQAALANREDRHWVYKREGLPCRVCGTPIVLEEMANRKLYWCPTCQR